ncbi:MAG: hypothetical protein WBV26_02195 [Candidatus Sulfotelmatobacter sp.]|jgi:hypothetical protein
MTETMVLSIGRVVERLIADSMFGMSLVLGWNLFRVGILQDQTGEVSTKDWKIRFQKVSPGIFFALFGAVGLAVALQKPLNVNFADDQSKLHVEASTDEPRKGYSYSYMANDRSDILQYVVALTTVEQYGIPVDIGKHDVKADALLKAKPILEQNRQTILKSYWGQEDYDWYLGMKADPVTRSHLKPAEQDKYEKIDRSANTTFATNVERN